MDFKIWFFSMLATLIVLGLNVGAYFLINAITSLVWLKIVLCFCVATILSALVFVLAKIFSRWL